MTTQEQNYVFPDQSFQKKKKKVKFHFKTCNFILKWSIFNILLNKHLKLKVFQDLRLVSVGSQFSFSGDISLVSDGSQFKI